MTAEERDTPRAPFFGWPAPSIRPWRTAALVPLALAWPWVALMRHLDAPPWLVGVAGLVLCLLGLTATVTDLLWRRIYNWTTYTAAGWLVVLHLTSLIPDDRLTSAIGVIAWRESLVGLLLGFGLMFLLYSLFGGGGGDLKLVTVFGGYIGPNRLLESLVYGYIIAGVVVGCYLVWVVGPRGLFGGMLRLMGLLPRREDDDPVLKQRLPMGPFLTLGAALAMINQSSPLF